jgi:hypothetical protein
MNDIYIELPSKEIFDKMKINVHNIFPISIKTSINSNYLNSRKEIFNTLNTINRAFRFKSRTFFLCVYYLDIIHLSKKILDKNINLLGLACLVIATKACENDPEVPLLKYFLEVYNMIMDSKSEFTIEDLSNAEIDVIKLLNYKINYYTIYDFNSFFFNNGILKMEQLDYLYNNSNETRYSESDDDQNYYLIKNILEQIYKKSRYYIDIVVNKTNLCFKYNSLYLSLYIIERAIIEILGNEQKINLSRKEEREDFYKKNSSIFKGIIYDFYKMKIEVNEQYKKIIKDKEMLEIFDKKETDEKISHDAHDERISHPQSRSRPSPNPEDTKKALPKKCLFLLP